MDECHPCVPQSPYAATKLSADKLAESFFRTYQLPVTILRPFNTFGPRQSMRAVIPTIISQLLHGNNIRMGNTAPRRDLTYVTDTVDGFIRAALAPHIEGESINLGVGQDWSIAQVIQIIARIMDKKIHVITEEKRMRSKSTEVGRLLSDNSKARKVLGWKPSIKLETGLKQTIEWLAVNSSPDKIHRYTI
jgi:dTDP-glucose 4,6-dehydratase